MGHEFSARVTEVGAGVTNVKPGDVVVSMPIIVDGANMAAIGYSNSFNGAYAEAQPTGAAELAARVSAHPKIKVHLSSTVAETAGAPGRFQVKIAQESGNVAEEAVGAIVQATGFTPYDLAKLPELGGGQANVVDQAGLEALAMAANGGAIKRADGKEVKSVVFVQCAGQRGSGGNGSGQHLEYCSGHCCGTSIKQAMYFKDANPEVDTVVMYQDLRVPGMGEDFYRSAQNKGVIFSKGVVSGVSASGRDSGIGMRRRSKVARTAPARGSPSKRACCERASMSKKSRMRLFASPCCTIACSFSAMDVSGR